MRCLICFTVSVVLIASAKGQHFSGTVPAGSSPISAGVNPVANKIYVANSGSGTVTIIDGATNATATIAVGSGPQSVAVNPLTNKVYVANLNSSSVTVIDGATAATMTVATGASPKFVAINPVTNKIYVANNGANTVTVIDGVTLATVTVAAGQSPSAIAVNPSTNRIYVTNSGSSNVTVINGANLSTTSVATGSYPVSAAVDVITNVIYVANFNSNNVTAINGADNSTSTFATGAGPVWVALNSALNKIYVANYLGNSVTAIDGMTSATSTISTGTNPVALTMDEATDTVYVANSGSNNITAINDATGAISTLLAGTAPISIAVNPVTNRIYAANYGSANITQIDGSTYNLSTVPAGAQPLAIAVNAITGKAYVANSAANTVTVIDDKTLSTSTITVGSNPSAIAVNPITNKIYVSCGTSVYVIDGITSTTTAVTVLGAGPLDINPVTNKIYVLGAGYITVLDGATNSTIALYPGNFGSVGGSPIVVKVNPATNKIYVAMTGQSTGVELVVVDGATNAVTSITTVSTYTVGPVSIFVNPVTNKIYLPSYGAIQVVDGATNSVTAANIPGAYFMDLNPVTNKMYLVNSANQIVVWDLSANTTSTVAGAQSGYAPVLVNPFTNKIYVTGLLVNGNTGSTGVLDGVTNAVYPVTATGLTPLAINQYSNRVYGLTGGTNVAVITESLPQNVTIQTAFSTLPNNQTSSLTPSFTMTGFGDLYYGGNLLQPNQALFQLDTQAGPWTSATGSGFSYSATPAALQPGLHTIYGYEASGEDATSVQSGSPIVGALTAYEFLIAPAALQQQTVTFGSLPPQAGTATSITITASALTPVSFTVESNSTICRVSGNTLYFDNIGVCQILATAQASSVYQAAYAETAVIVIRGQYIAPGTIPPQKVGTTIQLNFYDSAQLPITYTSTTPYNCTVSGSTASLLNAGSCGIMASQPGNTLYAAAAPVTQSITVTTQNGLGFFPITPCRLVDTRGATSAFGGPTMSANSTRSFQLPQGSCGLPATAAAYSLNVTVVPSGTLGYLTLWPTGQTQPVVSTLNSYDGRIVANAAIVPSGTNGAINAYVTNQTDVIIDVNGYFGDAALPGALTFVPATPCRVEDTRNANGTFGGPILQASSSRSWPVPASACSIPSTAAAYSLNETVVPTGILEYLTLYPTGGSLPYVSTLNSFNGQVVANAAIVPAGTGGAISAYVTDQTDLITDINGYFTNTPATPVVFNAVTPCRLVDTRNTSILTAGSITNYQPQYAAPCGIPGTATAYALNVTVVPTGTLGYLTIWPTGQAQPFVSTLNSYNGQVVANAAIVPSGNGAVSVYVTNPTQLIIDIVGYFAPPL